MTERRRRRAPTPASADSALPTTRKEAESDLLKYVWLIYGREKIGKTTLCSTFPDTLFLTTEPGSKGLEIFEVDCRTWADLETAVDNLEAEPERFKTIVIDTVDRAYDLCLEHVCDKLGIKYPGTDAAGREDFGKSWKEVKNVFRALVHRIIKTGRGLVMTSHAVEQDLKSRSGESYTRIFPSMSKQARTVVEALVDFFFFIEYMRAPDGETRRVIITEGDEMVWAGARKFKTPIPRLIPLVDVDGYAVLKSAFNGEDVGLDSKTLLPSKTASEPVREFFKRIRQRS